MKKIGIITFHFEDNYGAVLQSFALEKYLLNLNYDVEIIDFRSENMIKNNKRKGIKSWINFILSFFWIKQVENKFESFRKKYYIRSKEIFSNTEEFERKNLNYDVLIAGSDQIWNQTIDYQRAFYLNIKGAENIKKISYASSFGKEEIEEEHKKEVLNYIDQLSWISVREDKSKEILEKELNREIYQVLDPVFLLSPREWKDISLKVKNKKLENGYILVYTMETNLNLLEFSKKVSEIYKIPRVFLDVGEGSIKKVIKNLKGKDEFILGVGPREFISLIDNATLVITNSFHGVAFSTLLGKPFLNIAHSKRNLRMESLMRTLQIEGRVYKNIDSSVLNNKEELKKIIENIIKNSRINNTVLELEIKKSKEYLEKALE